MPPVLTSRQLLALLDAYREGAGPTELARRFGVAPDTVYYHARQAGIARSVAEAARSRERRCRLRAAEGSPLAVLARELLRR